MGNQGVFTWETVPKEEVLAGIVRQRITGDSFTVVRYSYAPGSVFPTHSHPEEQLTIVHRGSIEFTVDGERQVLTGGSLAIIPPETPHGARVVGDELVVSDNYIASSNRSDLDWSE